MMCGTSSSTKQHAAPANDGRSATSDARIAYIHLSSPGNQEVLPVNSILTGIDVELTIVQIAMPQARLQGHDLGKPPKGIGPWMVSVTQEACEYLVDEAELMVTSPMGAEVIFHISECDMHGERIRQPEDAEAEAARATERQARRERAREATVLLGYDLPPARLSSLLSQGELTYETTRITETLLRALPASVPRPEIRFHHRQ